MSKTHRKTLRKILIIVAAALLLMSAIISSGCEQIDVLKENVIARFDSGKLEDKAVSVVRGFFDAVIDEDLDTAYKYIYISQDSLLQDSTKNLEDFKAEFESITKIVSFEINWVEVKNNIAIVGIDLIDTYDGEEKIYKDLQVSLVLDSNEEWKINFWN